MIEVNTEFDFYYCNFYKDLFIADGKEYIVNVLVLPVL